MIAKLAIGTVQFGLDYGITNKSGKTPKKEVAKILDYAAEAGIDTLDTAEAYGESEKVIGELHCNRFRIVTKIKPGSNGYASVAEGLKHNLERLKLDSLFGVLFHSAKEAADRPGAIKELMKLRDAGSIEKIGYSVYTPQELTQLIDRHGIPDLIQIPFSHLDQRFSDLALKLHEQGVEIHSRSTFLQGLFFSKVIELEAFFDPVKPYLKRLNCTFQGNSERAGFLLRYAATKPFIDKVVLGINDLYQLKNNIKGLSASKSGIVIDTPEIPERILMPFVWPKS